MSKWSLSEDILLCIAARCSPMTDKQIGEWLSQCLDTNRTEKSVSIRKSLLRGNVGESYQAKTHILKRIDELKDMGFEMVMPVNGNQFVENDKSGLVEALIEGNALLKQEISILKKRLDLEELE